ncbi:RTA1-domain-containing protein [Rickenella mellea]|uniref:RTA1-domain-containing protein n=1 Tax=Rickenella mellea TaxID=50990 RepID=A0A4Y7QN26_9AGAM|nr:RTA1-domain-containing protein [Rickenella mellea]
MPQIQHGHHDVGLYGYIPTQWVCITFIVLFGLSTTLHIGQAVRNRLWFMFPTAVLAGIGEVIGWSGRLWSSHDPGGLNPYLMQICTTIISPTPLVAANFVILGIMIKIYGPQYSRLSPNQYNIIFCSADLVALIVQAVGGASAAQATETGRDPTKGGHIMLAGIVIQLVSIIIYVVLAAEFLFRLLKKLPILRKTNGMENMKTSQLDRNGNLMLLGLSLSTLCIFIRAVYRTAELSNGWTGRIIRTQVLFNVLDGGMITIAIFTINFLHPGMLLPQRPIRDSQVEGGKSSEHPSTPDLSKE